MIGQEIDDGHDQILCPHVRAGRPCPNFQNCSFWHPSQGMPLPSSLPASLGVPLGPSQAMGLGLLPPTAAMPPQNYKTKKCRHFDMGRCKLASLCNFAHGDEDLRVQRVDLSGDQNLSPANTESDSGILRVKQIEESLEGFAKSQGLLIENLKALALNFDNDTGEYSEQTAKAIQDLFQRIYIGSIQYREKIERVANKQLAGSSKPDNESDGDSEARIKVQLSFLAHRLKQIHAKNAIVFEKILKAEKIVNTNLMTSAEILQEILYDESFDKNTQALHRMVIEDAKKEKYN